MRKLTILTALTTVAILSISDSASACWRCRFRVRHRHTYYAPVTQYCPPVAYVDATTYTGTVWASGQQASGQQPDASGEAITGTGTAVTGTTGTDTTGTGATDTGAKQGDPITAEEQTWFNEMYPASLGLDAEAMKAVQQGWANTTHADRKSQYDKHLKMIKDAEDKAAKEQAEKDKAKPPQ
jgi:hypothetical protein